MGFEVKCLLEVVKLGKFDLVDLIGGMIMIILLGLLGVIVMIFIINYFEVVIVGVNKIVVCFVWDG